MTTFRAAQLITDLGGPRVVRDLLRKNRRFPREVEVDTIRKWKQRNSIPPDDLVHLLLAVEARQGRSIELELYVPAVPLK